ncbi:hypothetical protein STFE110948_02545 [Streptobacillus felis]|uniref:hypothetical protein n=1 Tax=Streptobacillus felis TaxID=1384509 RepID=UPI0008295CF6|nr:hypothetical protein [Streptobacillus felis]
MDYLEMCRIADNAVRNAGSNSYQPDLNNFVSDKRFKSFVNGTKEQVYSLHDEDKRLQGELDEVKQMMQSIINENKELKLEIEKLKQEKQHKDYYSLDL